MLKCCLQFRGLCCVCIIPVSNAGILFKSNYCMFQRLKLLVPTGFTSGTEEAGGECSPLCVAGGECSLLCVAECRGIHRRAWLCCMASKVSIFLTIPLGRSV